MILKHNIEVPMEKDPTGWYKKTIINYYSLIKVRYSKEGFYITNNLKFPMLDFRINYVMKIFYK